ncbi:MAG: glutamate synthase large subunit [Candidatus Limiplasma sp.]|nr:glutamate synthase large subunit [Candidatus Limiplasma sp.]
MDLYEQRFEHDACGIGAVVSIDGVQSRTTVDNALKIVEKLEHRAGKDADGSTGDGVGILLQIPHRFFAKLDLGFDLGEARDYGVGMLFLPGEKLQRAQAKKRMEVIAQKEGLPVLGWRAVPVAAHILGEKARSCMPVIEQLFIKRPGNAQRGLDFDRRLFILRRSFEQISDTVYVCSFSSRTIVYKGMFLVGQLRAFYPDLQSEDCVSAMAMVHSRFSTNTFPSWERAHPYRLVLHNGEINTIRGNVDRMISREETMSSPIMQDEIHKVLPVVDTRGSDSAMLDNTLEFLMMNGMPLPLAVMITIPEPWQNERDISRTRRDLYRYYATMMEPWDGPASLLFTDGDVVGAVLDRNGLRPSRYYITADNMLILSSEVGALDIPDDQIVKKSRVRAGRMLLVDTVQKRIIEDEELKESYAARRPYGEWLDGNLKTLQDLPLPARAVKPMEQEQLGRLYKAFGYTYEEVKDVILPMAKNGSEPTASMGTDIPLAVLSEKHQPLFSYFKQLFAQVTNPPIDAIREKIVTDTAVYVGADGNLLEDRPENCKVLRLDTPILSNTDLQRLMTMPGTAVIPILNYKNTPLERALQRMFIACDRAYKNGASILVLSDRGVDENHVPIPSLLAVSALEQYLIKTRKRTAVSVVLESAEPRDVHQFALLLGYGARAVNPYLALECVGELIQKNLLDKDRHEAEADYIHAVVDGVTKIASKMGISILQSYQSAQIFEAVGIEKHVIDEYFTNTVSRVGGIGLKEIAQGAEFRHNLAFDPLGLTIDATLDSTGIHRLRSGSDKEDHMYNPLTITTLQRAVREGSYERFKQYTALVDDETMPHTLRGVLAFAFEDRDPIPLEEVEPAEEIVRRFKTGAMSYGSISQEAHECLAEAMNRLGGRSNSGEGGEKPSRLNTQKGSKIKQVASGRFGVTSEYLMSAQEIQIKMAQGAKPGEGGHLPGSKVYPWIAETRMSTPGVSLISPPPHHDIYSIEDLAQLIYDLKSANRAARISVKLVSEAGVGTIAAGVAKAGAQVILISGYDGGTGAAPRTSIHDAGLPWELGLAEAHQVLSLNGLRTRIALEADGKLMSGRDVAIACMLGAEEFGFATAPLVAMGCVMMRVCNLDTCPVGVATQNPELRKLFRGKPEHVMNFMLFIAQELREIMAKLGMRTVRELVGRGDLLRVRKALKTERMQSIDMSAIIGKGINECFDPSNAYDFHTQDTLDERVLLRQLRPERAAKQSVKVNLSSTDRTFGTIFGSEVTRLHGNSLGEDTFVIHAKGGGGQSFGAWIPKGVTLHLTGDSNDYFGKGLSGGKLTVRPPKGSRFQAEENIIIGNVALYGATGGQCYVCGQAGERFCVRNSGAVAVVEGVGDHGCEYMTGGRVAVLGQTGRNFAAGMSGGVAYVLDEGHDLYLRVNKQMVDIEEVALEHDVEELRGMIEAHVRETGSPKGKHILADFDRCAGRFKKILPRDYKRMLSLIARHEEQGLSKAEAELEAFREAK